MNQMSRIPSWLGQPYGESTTLTRLALRLCLTTMCGGYFTGKSQSEAGAAAGSRPRPVGAIKPLEDVGQLFRRNTWAVINHLNNDPLFTVVPCPNSNLPTLTRILHCIVQQIEEQSDEFVRITTDTQDIGNL